MPPLISGMRRMSSGRAATSIFSYGRPRIALTCSDKVPHAFFRRRLGHHTHRGLSLLAKTMPYLSTVLRASLAVVLRPGLPYWYQVLQFARM